MKGSVRLVFQPAEEGGAGAFYMIKEGALSNAEAIFGMHVDFRLPTGTIASISGPALAAVSFFEARIEGKGGHRNIDPILATSFVILALQNLISRETDPLDSQVYMFLPFSLLTFSKHARVENNVIYLYF